MRGSQVAQWVKDLGLSLCGSGHCCGTTLRELPHVVGAAKKKKKKDKMASPESNC